MDTNTPRPDFPSISDLPALSPTDAADVLACLRLLVRMDVANVYTAAGSNDTRWNVWLETSRRRVELTDWATEILQRARALDQADWLRLMGQTGQTGQNGGAK